MIAARYLRHKGRGFVLVSSILLLLVMSIIAVSMFRSFGMQEKIAGNVREKQRALNSAQAAEQYAEAWLRDNPAILPITCNPVLLNANVQPGQICNNALSDLTGAPSTSVPWKAGVAQVGISFTPGTAANGNLMSLTSTDGSAYYDAPRFYIQHLVDPSDPLGLLSTTKFYQIDAVGYGGSGSAVAVVRATFSVHTETNGMGGP